MWRGDIRDAEEYISDCLPRAEEPIDKATVLKLRSQCHWQSEQAEASMKDVILALEALGIDLDFSQDPDEVNAMFEQVKNEVWERSNATICVTLDALHRSWRRGSKPFCLCLDVKMKRSTSP